MKSGRYRRDLGAVAVRHLEAEVVVLRVGAHARVRLGDAAELGLPVAVEDDPVDMVLRRRAARVPAVGLRRGEADVRRRAGRVVRIEQRLDRPLALKGCGDAGGDPVAGHVGEVLVHEQRGIRAALADEARVEPLLRDPLELAEQVQLRLLAGVAPLRVEQLLRQMEEQRRRPHVLEVLEGHVCRFADDALVPRIVGPTRSGVSSSTESALNVAVSRSSAARRGSPRRAGNGSPVRRARAEPPSPGRSPAAAAAARRPAWP